MAIITVKNRAITLDAAEIPNLDASKITSGSFADARIPNLATSKITSGTFADARISSSSVTQHSAPTDLQPIKSDISALALREATNESSAAFNLPNQFIDTFATDILGTKTNVSFSGGSLISGSSSTSSVTLNDSSYATYFSTGTTQTYRLGSVWDYYTNTYGGGDSLNDIWTSTGHQASTAARYHVFLMDLGATRTFSPSSFSQSLTNGSANSPTKKFVGFNNRPTSTDSVPSDLVTFATFTGYGQPSTQSDSSWSTSDFFRYLAVTKDYSGGDNNSREKSTSIVGTLKTTTISATATAIQAANTVGSAKTKVGGTLLYKDAAGTNTLGTDLKVYFTCNGGSNWTEAASYNAITPVYSTGVKQVRLGETTCTSGTDVRYKIEWANQASTSKEAQVHGIGINY
tara:strand:- start:47 stop:1255 length:1209 start_codon:yes stop_codon:yes gene_type:complete